MGKKPLEPQDFPIDTEDNALTKSDGEKIADAKDEATAEEIRNRLNADHDREEEDRWGIGPGTPAQCISSPAALNHARYRFSFKTPARHGRHRGHLAQSSSRQSTFRRSSVRWRLLSPRRIPHAALLTSFPLMAAAC